MMSMKTPTRTFAARRRFELTFDHVALRLRCRSADAEERPRARVGGTD
jgi:hypothetical protein